MTSQKPEADVTPGPNMYSIPSCLGRHVPDKSSSGGAKILGRLKEATLVAKTPAPNAYDVPAIGATKKKVR